jgi:DNA-binding response OmpR family regulator
MADRQHILVCENEPLLVELLQFRLKAAGYNVEVADNGLEANARLQQRLPRALIGGDFIPFVDGFELLRRLREDDEREDARDLPVIMLSRRTDDGAVLQALRLGVSEYVAKPFSAPELLARLEKVLRQGQIHRWAKSLQRKVRTPVSIPAHLWLADDRELPCTVRDLSENGFMAQLPEKLEQGSWLGLLLPGHGVLRAQVRWCRNSQMGGLFERRLQLQDTVYSQAA